MEVRRGVGIWFSLTAGTKNFRAVNGGENRTVGKGGLYMSQLTLVLMPRGDGEGAEEERGSGDLRCRRVELAKQRDHETTCLGLARV